MLRSIAIKHKKTVCIGRTHGQHAVPTTYGLKFAIYYQECLRNLERLHEAKKRIGVGKMSGATGTMATFLGSGGKIQTLVMKNLGLKPAPASNQVIQRDRHAEVMFVLALIAAMLEKIAKEIRNLQRTEILEVSEPFGAKQVGSSTMPQKGIRTRASVFAASRDWSGQTYRRHWKTYRLSTSGISPTRQTNAQYFQKAL